MLANILQNEKIMKSVYFISGLLMVAIGILLATDGETRLLHRGAFSILAICGIILVINNFLKDKWKSSSKVVRNSFTWTGYVIIISIVWDHIVNDVVKVPTWGLVVSYVMVVLITLIVIVKLFELINLYKGKKTSV